MSTDTTSPASSDTVLLSSGLAVDVLRKGTGAPLVFLHGEHGRTWDPLLDALAERYTVYAPRTPGADRTEELDVFENVSELALHYDDLCRALGLEAPILIGHSFGGMAAAEVAAHFPERVSRLVLIDALGLWLDQTPIGDLAGTNPAKVAALLFADPTSAAAVATMAPPPGADAEAATDFLVARMLSLAASYHFLWAIPDRNLRRRLHRVTAPTLLLWGGEDVYVPPVYADEFEALIADARIEIIPGAAHFPQLEAPDATFAAIARFLG